MTMSRYLLLTYFVVTISISNANAQASKWILALKPGLGISGTTEKIDLDRLTTDVYSHGFNFSGGVRLGYKFSDYLSLSLDAEWEKMEDKRKRIATLQNVLTDNGTYSFTNIYNYRNKFSRIQAPLSLQIYPFPDKVKAYVIGGIMPSLIYKGQISFSSKTTKPNATITEGGKIEADFKIPYNKSQDKDLIYLAGLGFTISRRFSAELIYRFNRPIRYMLFDPGYTMVGVPIYTIRANQGFQFSFQARLN